MNACTETCGGDDIPANMTLGAPLSVSECLDRDLQSNQSMSGKASAKPSSARLITFDRKQYLAASPALQYIHTYLGTNQCTY